MLQFQMDKQFPSICYLVLAQLQEQLFCGSMYSNILFHIPHIACNMSDV